MTFSVFILHISVTCLWVVCFCLYRRLTRLETSNKNAHYELDRLTKEKR